MIYRDFTITLIDLSLSYQGLAYKTASERISDYKLNAEKVWFVGLNALTKSEQVIIDYLKNKDIARVFWDADKLYYDNPIHEAGSFLREQREKWHEIDFNGVGNYWSVRKNNFQIIACPKSMSQVKVASEVLSQFSSDDLEKSKTAVVLADESLLYPMLNYLPSNVKKLNVTMGSELKKSIMFSFFQLISLFRLIQTLRNSGRFSFNNNYASNSNTMTLSEAYKILNLNPSKKITKEDVNKAYIKIQKKIHPDVSPETSRLSSLVNEAKEIVLKDLF